MYYRGADAAILVYDVTDARSFKSVKNWVNELSEHIDVSDDIVLTIAANKSDLIDSNSKNNDSIKSLFKQANDYASKINAKLWKVSAKTSLNINEMFDDIAKQIFTIKQRKGSLNDNDSINNSILDDPNNKKKCCNII